MTALVNKNDRLGQSQALTEAVEMPARLQRYFQNALHNLFCSSVFCLLESSLGYIT